MKFFVLIASVLLISVVIFVSLDVLRPTATLEELLRHVPDDAAMVIACPDLGRLDARLVSFGVGSGFNAPKHVSDYLLNVLSDVDDSLWERIEHGGPFVVAFRPNGSGPLAIVGVSASDSTTSSDEVQFVDKALIYSRDVDWAKDAIQARHKFVDLLANNPDLDVHDQDLAVYAAPSAWEDQIDQWLFWGGAMVTMASASQGEAAAHFVEWWTDSVRASVTEIDHFVVSTKCDYRGLRVSAQVRARSGGHAERYLASVAKTEQPLLRNLRAPGPAMVFAYEWSTPPEQLTLSEWFMAGMMDELATDDDPETVRKILGVYHDLTGQCAAMSFGSDGGMVLRSVVRVPDPESALDAMVAISRVSEHFMQPRAAGMTMTVDESEETISNTPVHVLNVAIDAEDPQVQQMINQMYGEELKTYFFVGEDCIHSIGGTAALAQEATEEVLKGDAPPVAGDSRVQDAVDKLSPRPDAFCLIDLNEFMRWGLTLAQKTGAPVPPPSQSDTIAPYLAGGLRLSAEAVNLEAYVPSESIKALAELFSGFEEP